MSRRILDDLNIICTPSQSQGVGLEGLSNRVENPNANEATESGVLQTNLNLVDANDQHRTRGCMILTALFTMELEEHIVISSNEYGQPIRPKA
ncbi:hypothetical protein ES332_D04G003800v1 [Gossypium tomentosum]|uniref:Uncharacterized protein n=1 Tax=Gossypium tomentosum TaxID=34277 RepID=A0A5D2L7V1_GOSTO|nr:hypothetical protein ES332_D04G003800v1 [Gossypium tomentosum]